MIFIYLTIIMLIFTFALFRGKNMLYWSLGGYLISSAIILISLLIYNIIISVNYSLPSNILERAGYGLIFYLRLHVSDIVTLYNFGNLLLLSSSVIFLIISDKKVTPWRIALFVPPVLYFVINHPRVKYHLWNLSMLRGSGNPFEKIVILNSVLLIIYFLIPIIQLARQYLKTHIFSKKKYALSTAVYIAVIEITMALVLHGDSYSNYYPLRYNINSLPLHTEAENAIAPLFSMQLKYTQLIMAFALVVLLYIFTCCDFSLTFNVNSRRHSKMQRENDEMLKTIFHTYKNAFFAIERFENMLESNIGGENKNPAIADAALRQIKDISHTYYINSKKMINSVVLTYDFNCEKTKVDLKELLNKTLLQFEGGKTINVEKVYPSETVFVNANSAALTEAFTNILNNAVDATEERGNPTVRISVFLEGKQAVINFYDNGCGIERNEIKNIFRPLYSKKSSSNNFGIGLSSALKTITYHSGTILCKSKPGEYTVFQVILPVLKL